MWVCYGLSCWTNGKKKENMKGTSQTEWECMLTKYVASGSYIKVHTTGVIIKINMFAIRYIKMVHMGTNRLPLMTLDNNGC